MNPLVPLVVFGAIGMMIRAVLSGNKDKQVSAEPGTMKDVPSKEVVKAIEAREGRLPSSMPAPIPGVSDAAWAKYVGMWKQADAAAVTTDGRRGVFLIGLPTLVDQGYMRKIGKGVGKDYHAEWKAPYSQAVFNSNLKLQYDILAEQAKRHYKAIQAQHAKSIGQTIAINDGSEHVPLTLSGALAVARQAGLGGLAKWIADPANRKGNTTEIFTKFNELF